MLQQKITALKKNLQRLSREHQVPIEYVLDSLGKDNSRGDDYPELLQVEVSPNNNSGIENSKKARSEKNICKRESGFNSEKQIPTSSRCSIVSHSGVELGCLLAKNFDCIEGSLLDMNKVRDAILGNIMQLMVTRKAYKIRQNFRELALKLLNLEELAFYVCHDSGRIQYQDFSSNFITEIMQDDPKCSALQKIFGAANYDQHHFVDLTDNSDLRKIFEIDSKMERNEYYGIVMNCASVEEEESFTVCLMVRIQGQNQEQGEIYESLQPKLLRKIIQISLISTQEQSKFLISKIYGKKMLDLLEILIIKIEARLKRIFKHQNKIGKESYFSITNLVKIFLSRTEENIVNQQIIFMIKKMAEEFEEEQYRLVEQIRMFKKYMRENKVTFMEFQPNGVLTFISGNKETPLINKLHQIWQPGVPVLKQIFSQNQKLLMNIKKAVRGGLKSERLFEIERDVKARICMNNRKIQKVHILIEEGEDSNPSDSLKEEQTFRIGQNLASKDNPSLVTIKHLEKENPGISKEGWLDLFLKKNNSGEDSLQRMVQKRNKTFVKTRKSRDEAKILQEIRNRKQTYSHSLLHKEFGIQGIDIENSDINVLKLDEVELEEFVLALLNQLDYFQCLQKEKKKLLNFIGDLQEHYQVHSNPFHNFRHGVNVMHTCYMLSSMPSNYNILNEKNIFAIVFSGLCHDVGHTGFTNAFEIASYSKKAMTYNDRSPLENYHAALTFELLRKEENNFLSEMDHEDFRHFRREVVDNILFTDIKEHFPLLKRFNELVNSGKILGNDDSGVVSNVIVHASDFGGSIKSFEVCQEWSYRVNQEFAHQYKVEGQLGLPQTPFMKDLTNPMVLSKAEGGFLKVIVYPLYQSLDKLYLTEGLVHRFKKQIEENIKQWEEIHRTQCQKQKQEEQLSSRD